jgi:hypothetical protein
MRYAIMAVGERDAPTTQRTKIASDDSMLDDVLLSDISSCGKVVDDFRAGGAFRSIKSHISAK